MRIKRPAASDDRITRVAVVATGIGASWVAYSLAQGLKVAATDPGAGAADKLRQTVEQRVSQFEAGNKVVTAAEVGVARRERDSVWGDIKAGALTLADGAPRLDTNLRLADELADAHTLSESATASLQRLQDQYQAAKEQAESHAKLAEDKRRELERV